MFDISRSTSRLIALVLGGLASTPAASLSAQEAERFSLSGNVAIFNIAGAVRIEPGTASGVVVEVMRGGEDAGELRVETGGLQGWQTLRVIYPDDRIVYPRMRGNSRTQFNVSEEGTFGRRWSDEGDVSGLLSLLRFALGEGSRGRVTVTGSGGGLEAYADLRVLVPAGQTVAVHLGVGEVHAANIDGTLVVDARSAPIVANGLRGSARLATGSGRITLDGGEGEVHLDTGSGSIRVDNVAGSLLSVDTGSGSVSGGGIRSNDVTIDTGSGSVEMVGVAAERILVDTGSGGIRLGDVSARDLDLDTGSGSIAVDLRSALRSARIDTGSGGVTLTVPPEFGAVLDLSTGSGSISSDLPVMVRAQRRTSLRGTIGDGSAQVTIDTGSGGIRIRSN